MADSIAAAEVDAIIFCCEAGIGSSLMGVNSLKKKLKQMDVEGVTVFHKPARQVPEDAKVVVCHKGMAKMVRQRVPNAVVVGFTHFLNDPAIDRVVAALKDKTEIRAEG